MSPFSLRKLGVGILDEGLNLFYTVKEPLLVAAGAVVARELEHEHRVSARGFIWFFMFLGFETLGEDTTRFFLISN